MLLQKGLILLHLHSDGVLTFSLQLVVLQEKQPILEYIILPGRGSLLRAECCCAISSAKLRPALHSMRQVFSCQLQKVFSAWNAWDSLQRPSAPYTGAEH